MSIAMTTVLPEPVAILKASRGRPSLRRAFSARMTLRALVSPIFSAASVEVDRRLGGLDLAEEEASVAVLGAPVGEEVLRDAPSCAGSPGARQRATAWRISLTISFGCCRMPPPNWRASCGEAFLGFGDRDEELARAGGARLDLAR